MSGTDATFETTVICQGCESECEVSIIFRDGKPACLGGNNCPTGEIYALSQVEKMQMDGNGIEKKRCFWCNLKNPLYVAYHDSEWGVPCHDERKLYELFILETFQAGLSWECILNKRENFRRAYDGFDLGKVCAYDDAKVKALMQDAGLIRNQAKLRASIDNSRIYRDITVEFGGFDAYLRSFTGGTVTKEPDVKITTSPLSDAIAKDLKKRGMRFVGSTTIYAFLQALGIIDAHQADCFLFHNDNQDN